MRDGERAFGYRCGYLWGDGGVSQLAGVSQVCWRADWYYLHLDAAHMRILLHNATRHRAHQGADERCATPVRVCHFCTFGTPNETPWLTNVTGLLTDPFTQSRSAPILLRTRGDRGRHDRAVR
jgi:hypothetical protein